MDQLTEKGRADYCFLKNLLGHDFLAIIAFLDITFDL